MIIVWTPWQVSFTCASTLWKNPALITFCLVHFHLVMTFKFRCWLDYEYKTVDPLALWFLVGFKTPTCELWQTTLPKSKNTLPKNQNTKMPPMLLEVVGPQQGHEHGFQRNKARLFPGHKGYNTLFINVRRKCARDTIVVLQHRFGFNFSTTHRTASRSTNHLKAFRHRTTKEMRLTFLPVIGLSAHLHGLYLVTSTVVL